MAGNRIRLDKTVRTLSEQKKREEPEYIDFEEAQRMMAGDLEDALESAENREPEQSPESLFDSLPAMNYKDEKVDKKTLEDEYRTDVDMFIPPGMFDDDDDEEVVSPQSESPVVEEDVSEEDTDDDFEDYSQVDPFDGADEGRPIEEEDVGASDDDVDNFLGRYEAALDDVPERVSTLDIINQASKNAQKQVSGSVNGSSGKNAKKQKSEAKSKGDKNVVKREAGEFAHLRDIPKVLVKCIQSEFPNAKNQNDAVVAWIVCHANETLIRAVASSLTEDQVEAIKSWQNSAEVSNEHRLDIIVKKLKDLDVAVDTLEMLLSYLVLDRKGFSTEHVNSPRNINMLENGVLDVIVRAEEQTKQMRNQRNIIQGRRKS